MGYATFLPNQTIIPVTDFTADITGDRFNVGHYNSAGFQFIWKNLTGTVNATVVLQVSNNAEDWDNITTTMTLSGANGTDCVTVSEIPYAYCRAVCTKNNVTGGTIEVLATFKE